MIGIKKVICLIVCALFFLIGCEDDVSVDNVVDETLICNVDSDCVAASCCHSDSCVNSEFKGDCSGRACTMECKPGTLDCGQGSCVCDNGKCSVKMR